MLEHLEICLAGEVLDLVRPWFELSVHKDRRGIGRWCEIHGDGKLSVFELARRSGRLLCAPATLSLPSSEGFVMNQPYSTKRTYRISTVNKYG